MKKVNFIEQLREYIAEGEEISAETLLADLPGWDSIGRLTTIALMSSVAEDMIIDIEAVKNFETVNDILNMIKDQLEE